MLVRPGWFCVVRSGCGYSHLCVTLHARRLRYGPLGFWRGAEVGDGELGLSLHSRFFRRMSGGSELPSQLSSLTPCHCDVNSVRPTPDGVATLAHSLSPSLSPSLSAHSHRRGLLHAITTPLLGRRRRSHGYSSSGSADSAAKHNGKSAALRRAKKS